MKHKSFVIETKYIDPDYFLALEKYYQKIKKNYVKNYTFERFLAATLQEKGKEIFKRF